MPSPITARVVCHTPGCENRDRPIDALWRIWDDDTGDWSTVGGFLCGPCGQPITDITTPEEAPPA